MVVILVHLHHLLQVFVMTQKLVPMEQLNVDLEKLVDQMEKGAGIVRLTKAVLIAAFLSTPSQYMSRLEPVLF